jgi:1-phosphofructokinase family hexose kinase
VLVLLDFPAGRGRQVLIHAPVKTTLVLSLNPAIDAEWCVDRVLWEEKNLIQSERRWAGGKGVNVARWLHYLGGHSRLLVPLGGSSGAELKRLIRAEKLPATFVPLQTATRTDIIVTTVAGRQLRFNPAGPIFSAKEWRRVYQQMDRVLPRCHLLVLSGSLPRSAPTSVYADLIRHARRRNVDVLLDCDGAALAEALAAKPLLAKPNEHELAQWSGQPLHSEKDVRQAARNMAEVTGGWVLVSRGPRAAYLINTKVGAEFKALPPRVEVANSVGAGDAALACVARRMEEGLLPTDWLRGALAAGSAAARCRAGDLPDSATLQSLARRIEVRPISAKL